MRPRGVPLVVLALAGASLLLAAVMFMTSPAAVARRERDAALAPTRAERAQPAVGQPGTVARLTSGKAGYRLRLPEQGPQ